MCLKNINLSTHHALLLSDDFVIIIVVGSYPKETGTKTSPPSTSMPESEGSNTSSSATGVQSLPPSQKEKIIPSSDVPE